MRVARERLADDDGLPAVAAAAVRVLADVARAVSEPWRDPAGVRGEAGQVSAVTACVASHPDALTGQALADLLSLRLRSAYLLNALGDSTGLAIAAAEPLVADCERLLGVGHPGTLMSRNNLAATYQGAGRTADAIPLLQRTLADFERLVGADHPSTKVVCANLAALTR